jgi:uncharacterized membrane protein
VCAVRDVLYDIVKSLVILTFVFALTWSFLKGSLGGEVFVPIASMAVAYLFKKGKDE